MATQQANPAYEQQEDVPVNVAEPPRDESDVAALSVNAPSSSERDPSPEHVVRMRNKAALLICGLASLNGVLWPWSIWEQRVKQQHRAHIGWVVFDNASYGQRNLIMVMLMSISMSRPLNKMTLSF